MIVERPVRPPLRWSAVAVALAVAAAYVVAAPHTADLAAQTARAELFRRSGDLPYWTGWYAGVPTTSYSLVTPALLGLVGPVWLGAASVVAAAIVAVPLLQRCRRPRAASVTLALAAGLDVASGRTTFAVGVVVALLALLALEHGRSAVAAVLAVVTTVTSPVAGFLLLVVAIGLALADPPRRRPATATAAGAVAALAGLAWLSHAGGLGGYEPLTRDSLLMAIGTAAVVVVVPVSWRVRAVAGVTILVLLVLYAVPSPIGANATRLAVLGAAPAVVAAAWPVRRAVLVAAVVLAALLPLAQLRNDLVAAGHADAGRTFVQPLLDRLATSPIPAGRRLEVVDTASHWPSAYLLAQVRLARGWERQTDEARNPMFYGRAPLTAVTYRQFLDRNAVGAVALPTGVPFDYGATREAALVAAGLPYLREAWHSAGWRLYDVDRPAPLVAAPATVLASDDSGVTVDAPAAGRFEVRLRWSPYLVARGATVQRAVDGDVVLVTRHGGTYRLHAVWRLP